MYRHGIADLKVNAAVTATPTVHERHQKYSRLEPGVCGLPLGGVGGRSSLTCVIQVSLPWLSSSKPPPLLSGVCGVVGGTG